MTSANSTSWEKELRKNICTNFGRGIRVNGENSGRTKLLYVYNEGLGSANKRTSQTLPIEWKKTSGIEILKAIEFIKPLVVKKNLTLKEATRRWKAQFPTSFHAWQVPAYGTLLGSLKASSIK